MVEIFKGLSFFILPLGFGAKRVEFFENQIRKFGGTVVKVKGKPNYVVVEDSLSEQKDTCLSALKANGIRLNKDVKIVKVKWVSKCFSSNDLIDSKPFEVEWRKKESQEPTISALEKRKNNDVAKSVVEECEIVDQKEKVDTEKYICSKPSTSSTQGETSQIKQLIIGELEKLANAYTIRKDTWRSYSYKKAINALMLYNKNISTFQEACSIPGIGEKMALKIMEIIESGKLEKVNVIVDEKTKILDTFCKIWGVGPSTAESWYVQGFRTLQDLNEKAKLSKQQQIGLKLYEDFQKRIPREEVVKISEIVKSEVLKVESRLSLEVVGSFRRGKSDCGDIDLMIVNPGIKSSSEILLQVTEALKIKGFLTDDLVTLEDVKCDSDDNQHKKYLGVFKLPGEKNTHRRIDFFIVPKSEYAAALMHYTGSALFNRSIRLWAANKQMTLTEHGLYKDTIRKGSEVKIKGQLITTDTEEDIFKELGLPYRHPEERDH